MNIQIVITKTDVFNDVGLMSGYAGAKKDIEGSLYDHISTSESDSSLLDCFWNETKNTACTALKRVLTSATEEEGTLTFTLSVSSSFEQTFKDSVVLHLHNFFVKNITAKWYMYTNKEEAPAVATEGNGMLEEALKQLFYKKRPTRPHYSTTPPKPDTGTDWE